MSMFESGASCDGHAMFSADSGPKSHACAPRSCQSKQFSQVECAGSSGRMTSPVLEGRAETKEKLFCHARGCLSEQVAQTASTAAWLCKNALRAGVSPPTPGALTSVLRTREHAISAHGGRRARDKRPHARRARARPLTRPSSGTDTPTAHEILPTRRHRRDATRRGDNKNRQPYPAPG